MSESTVTETVTLSINEVLPITISWDYSFSENNFGLSPTSTKNVTLSLTIEYGGNTGNRTVTVDSNVSFRISSTTYYDLSYTSFYVEMTSTVTPLFCIDGIA